jgi:AcrR family transcriptional regulator
VIRDSAATRQRILQAATAEFAAHGLAGARIDRIAKRAGANKQLIYAYIGDKEELFDATLEANIEVLVDSVPFDADDLPSYARRLRLFNIANPDLVRLVLWHSLERPGRIALLPLSQSSGAHKAKAIAAAQAAGRIDASLPPDAILQHVLALVHANMLDTVHGPTVEPGADADDGLEEAVRRIVDPRALTPKRARRQP